MDVVNDDTDETVSQQQLLSGDPKSDPAKTIQKLTKLFFDEYSLADAHIQSFNWFIHSGIHEIIQAQVLYTVRVQCEGGVFENYFTPRISNYYLSPPTFDNHALQYRRNTKTNSSIMSNSRMFPNDARLHNNSMYAGNFWIDLDIEWHDLGGKRHNVVTHHQPTQIKHIYLGRMPIMTRSDYCSLTLAEKSLGGYSDDAEVRERLAIHVNECPHDQGGYFIVNGNERVVTAHQHIAHNQLLLSGKSTSEHRSTSNDTLTTTNTLHMQVNVRGTCSIRIPYVEKKVPFMIVLYAMGYTRNEHTRQFLHESVRELFDRCMHQVSIESIFSTAKIPFSSVMFNEDNDDDDDDHQENYYKKLEHASLIYLANLCNHKMTCNDPLIRIVTMRHKLWRDLFTNISLKTTHAKVMTFLHMFERLARTSISKSPGDDIDHRRNRRTSFTGLMFAQLFRTILVKICRDARILLQRNVSQNKQPDFLNAFKSSTMTHQFHQALATGNWFCERSNNKSGVTQQLNRQCFLSYISTMRRMYNQAGQHDSKSTKRRSLPSSAFGLECPGKTPEGQWVGLVTNIALFARSSLPLPRCINYSHYLRQFGALLLEDVVVGQKRRQRDDTLHLLSKIFMNGALVGYHHDLYHLHACMRNEKLDPLSGVHRHTSIVANHLLGELHIRTDGGRVMRPIVPLFRFVPDRTTGILKIVHRDTSVNPLLELIKQKNNISGWIDTLENEHRLIEWVDAAELSSLSIRIHFNETFSQTYTQQALPDLQSSNTIHQLHYVEMYDGALLGLSLALVPYLNRNQSPRNMYHAAMSEQTVSLSTMTVNKRFDTRSHSINYIQKPLSMTAIESALRVFRDFPTGQVAIVAILCYSGYNMDDAIIFKQEAAERGMFNSTSTRSQRCERRNYRSVNEEFGTGETSSNNDSNNIRRNTRTFTKVDPSTGEPKRNTEIVPNDVLIAKTSITYGNDGYEVSRRDSSLVAHHKGVVDDVYKYPTDQKGNEMIRARLRNQHIPEIGDKFSSRHGQKGVVGMMMRQVDMPFNPITGMTPDLIVNPHGFTSRMTIAQLVELLAGKAAAISGELDVSAPFEELSDERWRQILKSKGFDEYGREQLYNGQTGEPLEGRVFMGPMYIERLIHLAAPKNHSRSHGPRQILTRQPVEGIAQDGGLRNGEMERDVIIANGAQQVLIDRIMQSDATEVWICQQCGSFCECIDEPTTNNSIVAPDMIVQSQQELQNNNLSGACAGVAAIVGVKRSRDSNELTVAEKRQKINEIGSKPKDCGYCTICKSSLHVIHKIMPYASKLFIQEMKAMSVNMKLKLNARKTF